MSKSRIAEQEVNIKKLEELYKSCGGRTSHFLFLGHEPKEYVEVLVKKGYIKYVKNSSEKAIYRCTDKLIEIFRDLEPHEKAQIKAQHRAKAEQALRDAEELANLEKINESNGKTDKI